MKKIIIFILLALLLAYYPVSAQTPSPTGGPTPTPTPGKEDSEDTALEKIRLLKEKVATKVAELRSADLKAFSGVVKNIIDSQISLATPNSGDITVTYNEDTTPIFTIENNKKEGSFKNIKPDTFLVVFGYFDPNNKTLDGRIVYIADPPPVFLTGKIADIDRENYTVSIKDTKSKDYIIDIETYTRTQSLDSENKIVRTGFSKLSPTDVIQVIGSKNQKEENRYHARRILIVKSEK
ncbi:hypothetical protein HYW54_05280 [Candidatus Gottesmanbacteria bacterium]|nr:hypothetical protein [Candidatus Gottesmanbacteria bacterium]